MSFSQSFLTRRCIFDDLIEESRQTISRSRSEVSCHQKKKRVVRHRCQVNPTHVCVPFSQHPTAALIAEQSEFPHRTLTTAERNNCESVDDVEKLDRTFLVNR